MFFPPYILKTIKVNQQNMVLLLIRDLPSELRGTFWLIPQTEISSPLSYGGTQALQYCKSKHFDRVFKLEIDRTSGKLFIAIIDYKTIKFVKQAKAMIRQVSYLNRFRFFTSEQMSKMDTSKPLTETERQDIELAKEMGII